MKTFPELCRNWESYSNLKSDESGSVAMHNFVFHSLSGHLCLNPPLCVLVLDIITSTCAPEDLEGGVAPGHLIVVRLIEQLAAPANSKRFNKPYICADVVATRAAFESF